MTVAATARKTACLLPQPTPPQAIVLAVKGRNLGRQWQPMAHPYVTPSFFPRLPTTFSTDIMLPIHH
eukprot:9143808-Ditylum_brightwellii.AAC.1